MSRKYPTAERVRELLDYNPLTGVFLWKVDRGPARRGKRAGCLSKVLGYRVIRIDDSLQYEHHLAWLAMTGERPATEIDHADCNKANNIWDNLRAADRSQQGANRRAVGKYPKGVTFHRQSGLFHAGLQKNGRRFSLGYFKTPDDAHAAYREAAPKIHGEFARVA